MQRDSVRRSVRASIKDGLAWAGMSGFVEPYVVPFALALGASNPAIGLLRSAPPLAASVAQLFNERIVLSLGSCLRAVRLHVLAQALTLFGAAAAVFLPPGPAFGALAAAMVLYTVFGNLAGPPWAVLMGEYIPGPKRGAFFGMRNQLVGVTFFAASFAAARFLNFHPGLYAFAALFAAAGLMRLLSFHYIGGMYESPAGLHMPRPAGSPGRAEADPALKPFLLSIFLLMFSVFLVAPYFSVYLLTELKYGYVDYMAVMTAGQLVTYLVMRRWGALADHFGSVRVIRFALACIPLVALFWALAPSFWWLVATEVFSGVAWAAYGMGTNNFVYELGGASNRTRYNALFGFTACLGQFAGALAGGLLYNMLPGEAFKAMLLLSAALRAAAMLPFMKRVGDRGARGGSRPGFLLAAIGFSSFEVYPAARGK